MREGWKTWPMHCMPLSEEWLVERMRSAILHDDMHAFACVYEECTRKFTPRGAAEWAGLGMAFDRMEERLWREATSTSASASRAGDRSSARTRGMRTITARSLTMTPVGRQGRG